VAFRNVIEYARQVFNSFARSTPRRIKRHPLPALTAPQHTNPSRNRPRVYRPACAELGDAAAASAAGLNALWRSRLRRKRALFGRAKSVPVRSVGRLRAPIRLQGAR
jgi:hypothetical protein